MTFWLTVAGMLVVTFGSLLAAGMNLLTALIGVAVGILGITITTGFHSLSSTTPTLAAMLGLAVGIDYALFILTRYRSNLKDGMDGREAAAHATAALVAQACLVAGVEAIDPVVSDLEQRPTRARGEPGAGQPRRRPRQSPFTPRANIAKR